jgi:hypothetical protein
MEGRSNRDQIRGANTKNSWAYEGKMRVGKADLLRGIRSARRSRGGRPTKRAVKGLPLDGALRPLP